MKQLIPSYIEKRIRRIIPTDSHVVSGSTPVVSFGNASIASVATLSLNPSRQEFLYENGNELAGSDRRLATHRSLETSDLPNAPIEVIVQVLEDCNEYFHRKPYDWFDQLEPILNGCGASYYNGTACHLDLVQWATDPVWGKLKPARMRNRLLSEDASFLIEQLQNNKIGLLLVNGSGTLKQLRRVIDFEIEEVDGLEGCYYQPPRLSVGNIFNRIQVIAWSTNIQSSWGVTDELRGELSKRVSILANDILRWECPTIQKER